MDISRLKKVTWQWWASVFFGLTLGSMGLRADVVLIEGSAAPADVSRQLKEAASYYGLSVDVIADVKQGGDARQLAILRDSRTLAVVLSANALPTLDRGRLLASLDRPGGKRIPLLILGIDEHTSPRLLREWSAGAIQECLRSRIPENGSWLQVAEQNEVASQLGGSRLPLTAKDLPYLVFKENAGSEWLLSGRAGKDSYPTFASAPSTVRAIFFATAVSTPEIPLSSDPYRQQAVFAGLAAPLLYLHYAAGDHAWHSPGAYANFTIDDLWLREPYGHVNYEELLRQAQQHDFHVTVAFIPWNYDRSEVPVAKLFRDNPDRLSICVHGNNHLHQEFGPLDGHPLDKQIADMKQGLARMEKFSQLTGIPYDRVMVFPHSIAPEATFAEMRRYNYLATANSLNVPSDSAAPAGADFALRAATLQFGGFPSLRRYSVETDVPEAQLAIDAFLGNPMLFYAHESFFASGIEAFDKTADTVNRLQPGTQWKGLGFIARHLYLERLRDDGDFDVRAFSADIDIANPGTRDAIFHVTKDEDFSQPLALAVDGQPFSFDRSGAQLHLRLPIKAGKSRRVEIVYGNDLDLAQTDISRKSRYIKAVRLLSDFRDNAVSNSNVGRRFIRSYADHGVAWNLTALWPFWRDSLFCCLALAAGNALRSRRRPTLRSQLRDRTESSFLLERQKVAESVSAEGRG